MRTPLTRPGEYVHVRMLANTCTATLPSTATAQRDLDEPELRIATHEPSAQAHESERQRTPGGELRVAESNRKRSLRPERKAAGGEGLLTEVNDTGGRKQPHGIESTKPRDVHAHPCQVCHVSASPSSSKSVPKLGLSEACLKHWPEPRLSTVFEPCWRVQACASPPCVRHRPFRRPGIFEGAR